ncbi:MAG TPA: hypothetical protein VE194_02545 [Rubrobacter sp.]|nr:hypothetical protein [Rubrobacter sp.]
MRVNGTATLWFWDDLGAVARPRLAGVVLPKAEDPDEISEVTSRLPEEAPPRIWREALHPPGAD